MVSWFLHNYRKITEISRFIYKIYEVPSIFYFFIHKVKVITTSVLVASVGMRNEKAQIKCLGRGWMTLLIPTDLHVEAIVREKKK